MFKRSTCVCCEIVRERATLAYCSFLSFSFYFFYTPHFCCLPFLPPHKKIKHPLFRPILLSVPSSLPSSPLPSSSPFSSSLPSSSLPSSSSFPSPSLPFSSLPSSSPSSSSLPSSSLLISKPIPPTRLFPLFIFPSPPLLFLLIILLFHLLPPSPPPLLPLSLLSSLFPSSPHSLSFFALPFVFPVCYCCCYCYLCCCCCWSRDFHARASLRTLNHGRVN